MKSLDSLQASAQYAVFDAVSLFRISLSLKILWQELSKREGLCKNTYRLGNLKVRERGRVTTAGKYIFLFSVYTVSTPAT